ncbi:MAG TPA: hypothetical protein VGF31_00710 [Myxococcaceae bacterium]|jgi:hypothetical protein
MKRPAFSLASIVLAGRHCHPLGMVLGGLLVVALGSLRNLLAAGLGI